MKKAILLSYFLCNVLFSFAQIDGVQLFDDAFLHEIRLVNADTNTYITTKDYQQVNMLVDGVALDSIGFKRKGNISGYPSTNKYGLKIKTNKYVAGKEYDGIREFTLHMNYQDPTMMREKLTYDICREMGLYSLRTAFAKVYINDVYWGLFTLLEGKDEMYKQVFDHRDMDAIESLDFGNMCYISDNPADYDVDANGGLPHYQFENGDPLTAWPRFAEMMGKVNNTPDNQYLNDAGAVFNLADFFKYQAINVYLMNFDSYIGFRGNQIYVYDTLAKKWQVTPWDFNASFGLWDTNNHTPSDYEMIPNAIANGCVAGKMQTIPQLKKYYLDAMCELNNTIGDTTAYFQKIADWKDQIQEAVYEDTRKVVSNADFDRGFGYGYYSLFSENQPALKTFITERLIITQEGLDNENYTCESTATIEQELFSGKMHISPNPAIDRINLSLSAGDLADYQLLIVDALGQVLIEQGVASEAVEVDQLPAGFYFIVLQNKEYRLSQKLVKR